MRRSLVAALLVSLLAAPASVGAQTPDVTAPQALPPAPTVDDPMLAPVARPRLEIGNWEDALRYVRARSTDLRIAAADVQRAEAQQRVALAGALPTITGTGTLTHNVITNETAQFAGFGPTGAITRPVRTPYPDYFAGSITLQQPVLALRTWYAMGTADVQQEAAKLSYEDAKRVIATSVANAIVGVVTAERVAELNRVGLRNALERYQLTQRKTALGGGTGLDVVRARQDVETARATLVTGDESLRQSREALGLALGVPEQVGVSPSANISGLEASARRSCRAVPSVEERPDVAALRTNVDVAHRGINDVKYQFAPTVTLQSSVQTTTVNTGAAPNTTWNVQGVLSVPIWDGGARYGNLHNAEAQELQAVEKLEAQRRKATIEVTQARRAVSVAQTNLKVATAARDLAAEQDRLTRLSYQEGRGTSLELVTAAQALRQAEIQLALREFELVKAEVGAVLALASCPF